MFVQIHMLQSMPPGNPNRDETGQPKKCIFGKVTRARISSQCLKRNIRSYFDKQKKFDALASRTKYLPLMVSNELKKIKSDISEDELERIKGALRKEFKAEKGAPEAVESEDGGAGVPVEAAVPSDDDPNLTRQLVFFPPPFARDLAEAIAAFMRDKPEAYGQWVGVAPQQSKKLTNAEKKKLTKEEKIKLNAEKKAIKDATDEFRKGVCEMSKASTVDIGMFGRMTTSDLLINVDAACQVAHALSTHEAVIESDYFTAMDDEKKVFAATQTEQAGAGHIGSGDDRTFFDSAVYYKYLNLDVDALKKHLSWDNDSTGHAAGALLEAAVCANPTGKQNSFANHGVHELILVEISKGKFPISYANAFLKPVEGTNLMEESAKALAGYVHAVAKAFSPADTRRLLLAVASGSVDIEGATRVEDLRTLISKVAALVKEGDAA
jgi:CRISPR system Cascade subunit CasC